MSTKVFEEKMERVLTIINALSAESEFRNRFVLKGGTAINLLYTPIPRLSVDGNYNFNINCSKEEMLIHRRTMEDFLPQFLVSLGYEIKPSRSTFGQHVISLGYRTITGSTEKIKIEMNYILRCRTETPTGGRIPQVGLHELYGAKLAALATRAKVRDLFDVHYLFEFGTNRIDFKELRKNFIFYWTLQKSSELNFTLAQGITEKDYNSELLPCLCGYIPTLSDMKKVIPKLSSFCTLSEDEVQFVNGFKSNLNLTHLLFDKTLLHPSFSKMDVGIKESVRSLDLF